MKIVTAMSGIALMLAAPAIAGNSLIAAGRPVAVAKSVLTVTPDREWNKLGARPGRNSESWTLDGDGLNDVTFYGGIEDDRTLFREVNRKARPLPRFRSTMLLTDIPALFEASYSIALDTPSMTIGSVEPATVLGNKGIRFAYTFTQLGEDVRRNGEAVAAIIGGRLYLMSFEAPMVFYYDRDIASYRAIVASAKMGSVAAGR